MKTIKFRLVAVYGAFAFFSVLGVIIVLILFGNYLTQTALNEALETTSKRFQTRLNATQRTTEILTESLAVQPNLVKGLADGNRFLLQAETVPLFKKLKEKFGVKQLQFHTAPATSFFRAHKPGKFGDDLSSFRHTVVAANTKQKTVSGVEKGVAGFGMRSVVPMFENGRHIGTVELGVSLEKTAQKFSKVADAKVALFMIRDGKLDASKVSTFDGPIDHVKVAGYGADQKNVRLIDNDLVDKRYGIELFPIKDYSGKPVLVAMVGIDKSAFDGISSLITYIAAAIAIVALLVNLAIFYWLDRTVFKRLNRLTRQIRSLAGGDTNIEPEAGTSKDEIAEIAQAVGVLRDNDIERIKLESNAHIERDREHHRQVYIECLIQKFQQTIDETLSAVHGQTEVMHSTAQNLSHVAISATEEANTAEHASAGASSNVDTVAAATEELVASVQEIASQTHHANDLVSKAVEKAIATDQDISALAEAAEKVGDVVGLIHDIADQTNLLALNATIEAARAGEAGKGFAVVASEVKGLASQTTKATEEIGNQVSSIQASIRHAVDAIRNIAQSVGEVSTVTTTIASAVEEQEAATREISNSIQSAANGTQTAMRSSKDVAEVIGKTTHEAGTVQSASDELAQVAKQLAAMVEKFLTDVARDVDERRQSLRVKMHQVVVVQTSGRRFTSTILDASRSGCKLDEASGVEIGETVEVELADGETVQAKIVREAGKGVGLQFTEQLTDIDWLNAA
ncbi:MAG: hypothetical protein C0605_07450 [Hyphomicrobiales bacterium]|nr:MAG: hypothetical protein C0605_07450 [Hyphomicrobiales bacterium]